MKIIGEKWALLAVREIGAGSRRFDEIVFDTGAPRDVLAARLRSLQAAGVVERQQYQERPARFEYVLTTAGEDLIGVIQAIREWGDVHARHDTENIVPFTHACGAELHPAVVCRACGQDIEMGSFTYEREVRRSDVTA